MVRAGLVAKKVSVQGKHGVHQTTVWVRSDAEHRVHLEQHRAAGTRASPGSQFTPEAHALFKRHGITKLPAADIMPSAIHHDLREEGIHHRSVMKWRDTTEQHKQQDSHTQEFHDRNQRAHYAVVKKLRPRFQAATAELMKNAEAGSDAHAAGAVIAHTGLRVGGHERVVNKPERINPKTGETIPANKNHGQTVHGVSTLQARHVTVNDDGSVRLQFVGKSGHDNDTTITDPAVARLITARVTGKAPTDHVFNTDDAQVRRAMPPGFRPKDMRTLIAWDTSERALAAHRPPPPMTGNPQTDMRNVLTATRVASEATARVLNNTAAVARNSYIHPDVWTNWARSVGVPAAWIAEKGVNETARNEVIPPRPPRPPRDPNAPPRPPRASAAARLRKE
jgi:hypothetical protein